MTYWETKSRHIVKSGWSPGKKLETHSSAAKATRISAMLFELK